MLARIRSALGSPEAAGGGAEETVPAVSLPRLDGGMAPIMPEDRVTRFEMEFKNVAGSPCRASTALELEGILRTVILGPNLVGSHPGGSQDTSVVLTRNPVLGKLKLANRLRGWGLSVTTWPEVSPGAPGTGEANNFREQCFSAGVGITGVDFLLAETGSLVLSSQTEGSQLASLAPPVHVALYRRAQVLSALDDILEQFPLSHSVGATTAGRSIVFITGPSRTADIEQILIRGVHGPREVYAVLVEESCLAEMAASDP